MLPNWLYGKSKSKLASILGGGGTPSDYNEVKAQVTQNTGDIALLDDALDTKAALTQISNLNLLDNAWFTVNQRGKNTYSTTSDNDIYTFDRWMLAGTATVSKSEDVITVTSDDNTKWNMLKQKLASSLPAYLRGKKVTLSILLSDGTIKSVTFTFPVTDPDTSSRLGIITIDEDREILLYYLSTGINSKYEARIHIRQNLTSQEIHEIAFKAIKLEVGEISTLGLDVRPNLALELAKCQRYFIRLANNSATTNMRLALGIASSSSAIIFSLVLPSQMRTTPTISQSSSSAITIEMPGSTSPTGTPALTINNSTANILRIDVSGMSGATASAVYYLSITTNGYIDFNAEL